MWPFKKKDSTVKKSLKLAKDIESHEDELLSLDELKKDNKEFWKFEKRAGRMLKKERKGKEAHAVPKGKKAKKKRVPKKPAKKRTKRRK